MPSCPTFTIETKYHVAVLDSEGVLVTFRICDTREAAFAAMRDGQSPQVPADAQVFRVETAVSISIAEVDE